MPDILYGCDISNFQGPPEAYRQSDWYIKADFVVVQAIRPPQPYRGWDVGGYTADQLRAAKQDGKKVGAYVWSWTTLVDVGSDITARLATIPDDVQLDFRAYLDGEDTTTTSVAQRRSAITQALTIIDAWSTTHAVEASAGLYSGTWYINGYLGGWMPPNRAYWRSSGGTQYVDQSQPVAQYAFTPVDFDVMLTSEMLDQGDALVLDPVPQNYLDLGWTDWRTVAINVQGIADALGTQVTDAQDALAKCLAQTPLRSAADAALIEALEAHLAQIAELAKPIAS